MISLNDERIKRIEKEGKLSLTDLSSAEIGNFRRGLIELSNRINEAAFQLNTNPHRRRFWADELEDDFNSQYFGEAPFNEASLFAIVIKLNDRVKFLAGVAEQRFQEEKKLDLSARIRMVHSNLLHIERMIDGLKRDVHYEDKKRVLNRARELSNGIQ